MIHARDVAVSDRRFDGVLVPASSLVLLQGCAVEEPFERQRAELHGELAVLREMDAPLNARRNCRNRHSACAESGGSGHAEPRSEVQRNGNARGQFVAIDEIGSLNILIAPVNDPVNASN